MLSKLIVPLLILSAFVNPSFSLGLFQKRADPPAGTTPMSSKPYLAYLESSPGSQNIGNIVLLDLDTRETIAISNGGALNGYDGIYYQKPVWRDTDRLTYLQGDGADPARIYQYDLKDRTTSQVYRLDKDGYAFIDAFAWSPEGTQLGLLVYQDGQYLVELSAEGQSTTLATLSPSPSAATGDGPDQLVRDIMFSPDGSKLLVVNTSLHGYNDSPPQPTIHVYDLKGNVLVSVRGDLPTFPFFIDNDSFGFFRKMEGAVYEYRISTGEETKLAEMEMVAPVLSPDSGQVAYYAFNEQAKRYELRIFDLVTKTEQPLRDDFWRPQWLNDSMIVASGYAPCTDCAWGYEAHGLSLYDMNTNEWSPLIEDGMLNDYALYTQQD